MHLQSVTYTFNIIIRKYVTIISVHFIVQRRSLLVFFERQQHETGGNSDVIWQKTRCMAVRCNRSVRAWFDNDDDEKHVSGWQQVISIVCIARRSTCGQSRISFMRHVPTFRKPKTRLVENFHNALRCNVRCRDCRWNRCSNDWSNNPVTSQERNYCGWKREVKEKFLFKYVDYQDFFLYQY